MNTIYDVLIIGGGASGMFAAVNAARKGISVALIERNDKLGKKLFITGKGRCNLTNNCSNEELLQNVPTNPRFLYSAISAFNCADTIRFFEDLGVTLKTERGNRVFPKSDKASDIVFALENACESLKVNIFKDCYCKKIITKESKVQGVKTTNGEIFGRNIIIATGGKSYCMTGSDGSGYALAQGCGHTITPLYPALIPIETKESYPKRMMGLSLKNVVLAVYNDGKKCIFKDMGELLFTHFGVSGPLVLSASSFIKDGKSYDMLIDFKPALDEKTLDNRILREIDKNLNKDFSNVVRSLLPAKAVDIFMERSGIESHCKANQLTKTQRIDFLNMLKRFPLSFKKFRPIDEAIITSGGVSIKEVNPKTMESKIINGLFFAGEILDIDAFTGGFNLQIAFSTANSAVNAIQNSQQSQ